MICGNSLKIKRLVKINFEKIGKIFYGMQVLCERREIMASREEAYDLVFNKKRLRDEVIADILYYYLVEGYTQTQLEEQYFPTQKTVGYTVSYIQQAAGLYGRNSGKYKGEVTYADILEYVKLLCRQRLTFNEYLYGGTPVQKVSSSNNQTKPSNVSLIMIILGIIVVIGGYKNFSLIGMGIGAVLVYAGWQMMKE